MRLVVDGFNRETDPYGKAWQPRKKPPAWAIRAFGLMQDDHKLLDKSGAGIDKLRARGTSTGIRFTTVGYMKFHLSGTRSMVARPWLPVNGLGILWGESFNRVAAKRIREQLGFR
jgi:hypothetical protein